MTNRIQIGESFEINAERKIAKKKENTHQQIV